MIESLMEAEQSLHVLSLLQVEEIAQVEQIEQIEQIEQVEVIAPQPEPAPVLFSSSFQGVSDTEFLSPVAAWSPSDPAEMQLQLDIEPDSPDSTRHVVIRPFR